MKQGEKMTSASCLSLSVAVAFCTSLVAASAPADDEARITTNHATPFGGLAGGGPLAESSSAGSQLTEADQERMRRGIERYVAEFGPLSRSDDHAGFAGPVPPPLLNFYPFGGRVGLDFNLQNYFDHASQAGGIQDWNCGGYTLDGIIATVGLVPTFDRQLVGIPVFAALDGVVVTTHDGEDDQNVDYEKERPTNFVRLDHGQGLQTSCFSLRKDSILVSPGDEVRAGQQIGEVASSGNTDWPGLGFATLMDQALFDPFVGPCNEGESLWADQPGIPDINDVTFTDFGVTVENLDAFFAYPVNERWQPPAEGYVPLDHDGVWMWARGFNLPANSTATFKFYDPSGDLHYDSEWFWLNFGFSSYRFWIWWWYWDSPGMQETPGTWRVSVFVNSELRMNFPLEIVAPGDETPNRAPQPINAAIEPSNPTSDDVLMCRVNSAGPMDDLDWDLVRFRYIWSVDGVVVRDTVSAGLADYLPRVDGCGGPVVTCEVIPSDGIVNGISNTASVVIPGCTGDITCDGSVDGPDLARILGAWNSADPEADVNDDGIVNGTDLSLVLGYWGACQ